MNKFLTILLASVLCAAKAAAQKHPVIADMDTRLPLTGVAVATDNGQRDTTDCFGRFHTGLPFASATLSKKHYMQRRIAEAELRQDTVFLIPQEVVLADVVVTSPGFSFDVQKALRSVKENASMPNPSQGFNMLGLLQLLVPSRKAKTQTRAQKIKKILENY